MVFEKVTLTQVLCPKSSHSRSSKMPQSLCHSHPRSVYDSHINWCTCCPSHLRHFYEHHVL